jgi:crotonobetainyl-CoA:carnitine CoA-transferase CaiB-like acyl-CoA transferase
MTGPLKGIKVLDLTTVFLGPYCTQLLGDLGAEVIKVEPPLGDTTRYLGPARTHGMSGTFLNVNRNKRSCVINLKAPEALEVLGQIAQGADVMVHNMRPAAAERLGITYEWARRKNPSIVYCGAYGYGERGRYAGRPAFDDSIQAISGIAGYQARLSGSPGYCGTVLADKVTGLMAANAIMAALLHRERTGVGQSIEVPMFETMVSFVLAEHIYGATFEPPLSAPVYPRVVSKFRRPYQTKDGYLAVVPYNDKQWKRFFSLVERPDLEEDPRFADMASRSANVDFIYEILAAELVRKTSAEWSELLTANDIPNVEIRDPEDLLDDPHLADVGFFQAFQHESEGPIRLTRPPCEFSETKATIDRLAPRLGEHTQAILKEFGFDDEDIAGLREAGIIGG